MGWMFLIAWIHILDLDYQPRELRWIVVEYDYLELIFGFLGLGDSDAHAFYSQIPDQFLSGPSILCAS